MEGIRFDRVCRSGESVEHYHRLYAVLKSVLPEYVGGIEMIEHSPRLKDIYSCGVFFEGEVVGGYVLTDNLEGVNLSFMGLTEKLRGNKIGHLMVEDMSRVTRYMGKNKIFAATAPHNLPKFNRLGFVSSHSLKDKALVGVCKHLV
jgi:hypothetical protein